MAGDGPPVVLVHGYNGPSKVNFATPLAASPDPSRRSVTTVATDENGRFVIGHGPTVESSLLAAGHRVVMLDLRGHGHSEKPHDPASYSMAAWAGDVRAVVEHVGLQRASLVGYSLGAMIASHLLSDPWVSRAALCGIGSSHVEGVYPELEAFLGLVGKCFLDGSWDQHPGTELFLQFARLDPDADFVALGVAGQAIRMIPLDVLRSASAPLLFLNGGGDMGASKRWDLAGLLPDAQHLIVGSADHGLATSDPLFQEALAKFLASS